MTGYQTPTDLESVADREIKRLRAELARVTAELAEARKDAERYRWLRDEQPCFEINVLADDGETWYGTYGAELDEAIDASKGDA